MDTADKTHYTEGTVSVSWYRNWKIGKCTREAVHGSDLEQLYIYHKIKYNTVVCFISTIIYFISLSETLAKRLLEAILI